MRTILYLFALALLGGCAMSPQLSAEQMNAVTSGNNANAAVVSYVGVGGQGTFSTVNTDRGALGTNGGSVTVKPTGEIVITVNPKPVALPKPEPPQ